MGFFDDLVLPEEPAEPRDVAVRLGPPHEDAARHRPPVDWFAPALVPQLAVAGEGPAARVMVVGWCVWPGSATLHLAVRRPVCLLGEPGGRRSGLRVGLSLGDGRRVTSLDPPEERVLGPARTGAAGRATAGLIALDPGLSDARHSLFKTDVDLYLPELPPPGETRLVVEGTRRVFSPTPVRRPDSVSPMPARRSLPKCHAAGWSYPRASGTDAPRLRRRQATPPEPAVVAQGSCRQPAPSGQVVAPGAKAWRRKCSSAGVQVLKS